MSEKRKKSKKGKLFFVHMHTPISLTLTSFNPTSNVHEVVRAEDVEYDYLPPWGKHTHTHLCFCSNEPFPPDLITFLSSTYSHPHPAFVLNHMETQSLKCPIYCAYKYLTVAAVFPAPVFLK